MNKLCLNTRSILLKKAIHSATGRFFNTELNCKVYAYSDREFNWLYCPVKIVEKGNFIREGISFV